MRLLSEIWKKWRTIGKKIASFQSQILFGILYLSLMSIVGMISRLFFDLLHIKLTHDQQSNFSSWQFKKETLEESRMQF
jgi:hypothetical protein